VLVVSGHITHILLDFYVVREGVMRAPSWLLALVLIGLVVLVGSSIRHSFVRRSSSLTDVLARGKDSEAWAGQTNLPLLRGRETGFLMCVILPSVLDDTVFASKS
jgi:hypothetical protein